MRLGFMVHINMWRSCILITLVCLFCNQFNYVESKTYVSYGVDKDTNEIEWFYKPTSRNVEYAVEYFQDIFDFTTAVVACANRQKYCNAPSASAVTCQSETEHSWSCNCTVGYDSSTGVSCKDINECSVGHACTTEQTCINTIGSYRCECLGSDKELIEGQCDKNECASPSTHTCGANAKCKNTLGSFICECDANYLLLKTGKRCLQALCSTPNRCGSHSICTDSSNLTALSFDCACEKGYQSDSNGRDCYDINECSNSTLFNCTANSSCMNSDGGYYCECDRNYLREGSSCVLDPCLAKPCGNYFACYSYQSGGTWDRNCTCEKGLQNIGGVCQDLNECLTKELHQCTLHSECVNTFGSYFCKCKKGYLKTYTDECFKDPCVNNGGCGANTRCVSKRKGYNAYEAQCDCYAGYMHTNDMKSCEDIDECVLPSKGNCPAYSTCKNEIGSYKCLCNSGYLKSGNTCVKQPCSEDACGTHSMCKDILNGTTWSSQCTCETGYESANGKNCTDINECLLPNACQNNSRCENSIGSHRCVCNPTYLPELDTCVKDPCLIGIPCGTSSHCTSVLVDQTVRERWVAECKCYKGYQSMYSNETNCEDINECLNETPPHCHPNPPECKNVEGSFYWLCNGVYIVGVASTTTTTTQPTTMGHYIQGQLSDDNEGPGRLGDNGTIIVTKVITVTGNTTVNPGATAKNVHYGMETTTGNALGIAPKFLTVFFTFVIAILCGNM